MKLVRGGYIPPNKNNKNWMTAMGILFIVMAAIIALRNLYFFSTQFSIAFYIDNYTNVSITNEKFVIGMVIAGLVLLFWGHLKKKHNKVDEYRFSEDLR